MIEFFYISIFGTYCIILIYSLLKLIQTNIVSSKNRLILALLIIFLQPLGVIVFWLFKFSTKDKNLANNTNSN
jgi:hypothetical protein